MIFKKSIFLLMIISNVLKVAANPIYYCPLIKDKNKEGRYYAKTTNRLNNISFYWVEENGILSIKNKDDFNRLQGNKIQKEYADLNPAQAQKKISKEKQHVSYKDFFFTKHKEATYVSLALCGLTLLSCGIYAYAWTRNKELPYLTTLAPLLEKVPYLVAQKTTYTTMCLALESAQQIVEKKAEQLLV